MTYYRRAFAIFNVGVYQARAAYHAAPSLNWCAIRRCWNLASAWGVCVGHRKALGQGSSLRLDDQVQGWPVRRR